MGLPPIVEKVLREMRAELDDNKTGGEYDPVVTDLLDRTLVDMGVLVATNTDGSKDTGMEPPRTEVMERANVALCTLLSLAKARVKGVPFNVVPRSTLRLYTDASVLLSALDLVCGGHARWNHDASAVQTSMTTTETRAFWLESVRRLDMAIIVAGAIGAQRMEWVQALIRATQAQLPSLPLPPVPSTSSPRPAKRPRLSDPCSPQPRLLFAPNPVPERSPPTPDTYTTDPGLTSHPFIMRGFLADDTHLPRWPALDRWKDARYLLERVAGEGRVVPVEVGKSYDEEAWGQRIVPFDKFLAATGWHVPATTTIRGNDEDGEQEQGGVDVEDSLVDAPLYLAQHALFTQFPSLERDIALPDYVWSEPPTPPHAPQYTPPPDVLTNVWIGPGRHVVSPAHTDPYFNCYAQVLGSKRVWLAPPSAGPHMYAYGKDDERGDEASEEEPAASTLASEYMGNTSTVPILRDGPLEPLRKRFPAFFEHVYPDALEAVLHPGDMLVMPPGWWHAMRGEGGNVCWSVSFWY